MAVGRGAGAAAEERRRWPTREACPCPCPRVAPRPRAGAARRGPRARRSAGGVVAGGRGGSETRGGIAAATGGARGDGRRRRRRPAGSAGLRHRASCTDEPHHDGGHRDAAEHEPPSAPAHGQPLARDEPDARARLGARVDSPPGLVGPSAPARVASQRRRAPCGVGTRSMRTPGGHRLARHRDRERLGHLLRRREALAGSRAHACSNQASTAAGSAGFSARRHGERVAVDLQRERADRLRDRTAARPVSASNATTPSDQRFAAEVDVLGAHDLLGAHVVRRPDERARARGAARRCRPRAPWRCRSRAASRRARRRPRRRGRRCSA